MELRDYIRGLRRHWLAIVLMTLLGAGTAYAWSWLQTPVYQATASGLIQAQTEFNDGQLMNDDHKVFWLARNRYRTLHRVEPLRMVAAFGQDKDPCTVCYPELRAAIWRSNSEDDYGHEPFEYDGVPICARCGVDFQERIPNGWRIGTRPVPWPCMSAIVLGLAPREEAAS